MKVLKGVLPILVTPFDDEGQLDEESLRKEVRFCVDAGAHGLVTLVVSSEFHTLTDDERQRVVEVVIGEMRRYPGGQQVPVVVGTAGVSAQATIRLSWQAEEAGVDAIIAMPPYVAHPGPQGVYDYYRAISDTVNVPIVVQNAPPPTGTPMAPELIAKMAREIRGVEYVKEETLPSTHKITELLNCAGEHLKGVFGGLGGRYFVDELHRGACGIMSAGHLVDVQRKLYDLFQSGDERGARDTLNLLLPVQGLWSLLGIRVPKEVLRRRGIIKSTYTRLPVPNLDSYDMHELDEALKLVEPLFVI